jgi:hypothetical protein
MPEQLLDVLIPLQVPVRSIIAPALKVKPFRSLGPECIRSGRLDPNGRRHRLRAVQLGRSWFTTSEWVSDFVSAIAPRPVAAA